MEVKVEKIEKNKQKLIITLSPKEMADNFKKIYEGIAPEIKIDGFRVGKAPRNLIEGAYGVSQILSKGIDEAISQSYYEVLNKEKIVPISAPNIVISKYPNYGHTEAEVKEVLEFEAEIETMPEVKLLDYKKAKIKLPEPRKASPDEVEKILIQLQKQKATFSDLAGSLKKGDYAEISYEGSIKGVKIDQMCSKNHPIVLGEGTLIPGFEENLVDHKKDDKFEFEIEFPKDYHAKEYAGKKAIFKIEILTAKKVELPKIDDSFAAQYGHKTAKDLRAAINDSLNLEMKAEDERQTENAVIEAMLPFLKVDLPVSLVDREVEKMLVDYAEQLESKGLNFDKYLEGVKKKREDLAKEIRPQAEKNIKAGLLLGKIIEEKKWDHHDPDIAKKALQHLIKELSN